MALFIGHSPIGWAALIEYQPNVVRAKGQVDSHCMSVYFTANQYLRFDS